MGGLHNGRNPDLLGSQAGMQVRRIEMAVYHVRSFFSQHHHQVLQRVLVKQVLVIGPRANHLNTVDGDAALGKLLRQWTGTRADHADVHSQRGKPPHEIKQVTLGATNRGIADDLHNRKRHLTHLLLVLISLPDDKILLRKEDTQEEGIGSIPLQGLCPLIKAVEEEMRTFPFVQGGVRSKGR
jgi:hypothetical protein